MAVYDEQNLKAQQAEKAYYASGNLGGAVCGQTVNTQAYGDCEKATAPAQFTEAARLHLQADQLRASARNADKIARILDKHPEFLEFLEVLRSGLV